MEVLAIAKGLPAGYICQQKNYDLQDIRSCVHWA